MVAVTEQTTPEEFDTVEIVPSSESAVVGVRNRIEMLLLAQGFPDDVIAGIRVALSEAFVNAAKHGNRFQSDKYVVIAYSVKDGACAVRVEDEGSGFDPDSLPDPTEAENLERPCGRGVLLMRHFMDVTFQGRGNIVTLRKTFANGGR